MEVAERNIEDRLKALTTEFHQARQAAITSELLDIISGFEALKESARRREAYVVDRPARRMPTCSK
jgi:F-type H+-transporting ATPase subunit gamma